METPERHELTLLSQVDDNLGPADVGVVLIHGIGTTKAGDMASNFAQGLAATNGAHPEDLKSINELGRHILNAGRRKIRFYDVHWSDLIQSRRQDFDFSLVRRAAWFPWFNHKAGLYDAGLADVVRTYIWWPFLMLALVGLQLMYRGTVVLWSVGLAFASFFKRDVPVKDQLKLVGKSVREIGGDFKTTLPELEKDNAEEGKAVVASAKRKLDDKLRIVSDVFIYVGSSARTLDSDAANGRCAQSIDNRMLETLEQAASACQEIHIVAHSLGTVITHRCVNKALSDPSSHVWISKLTHIHTMGCPLEKIRFFWPMVIRVDGKTHNERIRWTNFSDPFDFVAGRLVHFNHWGPVENLILWGLGGPARAHSKQLYQKHARFQRAIADRVLRRFYPLRRRVGFRAIQLLKTVGESIVVLAVALFALALGLVSILGSFIFAAPYVAELELSPWMLAPVIGVVAVFLAFTSYRQARAEHQEFLTSGEPTDEGR